MRSSVFCEPLKLSQVFVSYLFLFPSRAWENAEQIEISLEEISGASRAI
jgi:hypothetical protein